MIHDRNNLRSFSNIALEFSPELSHSTLEKNDQVENFTSFITNNPLNHHHQRHDETVSRGTSFQANVRNPGLDSISEYEEL